LWEKQSYFGKSCLEFDGNLSGCDEWIRRWRVIELDGLLWSLWRFYVELGRLMEFLKRVIRDLGGSW
jgi:hypothetical protein